ncbi:thiamine diphosphokinase [Candidatus Micrarchaeota archaeon]|nr:thiamine diphosphokinase [Candidatus Micrarchaeota archaeon]MBU2476833.1 thiamine diphosphokinase [Candidatus Micrarchaeota archaeon]
MQKKAVIVCNGSVNTKWLYSFISEEDFLIAADGGANKLVKTKFVPDLIIGDMDSISKTAEKKYRKTKKIKFPVEKDKIDLELALDYCIEKKFREIIILGAIGSRADMTLTNIFLLTRIPKKIKAKIIHEEQEIYLIPKKKFSIQGTPGERISLFPVNGNVRGLTLKGFKYELKNHFLPFGIGIGLSNEFKNKKALITAKDGIMLCVHFRKWF